MKKPFKVIGNYEFTKKEWEAYDLMDRMGCLIRPLRNGVVRGEFKRDEWVAKSEFLMGSETFERVRTITITRLMDKGLARYSAPAEVTLVKPAGGSWRERFEAAKKALPSSLPPSSPPPQEYEEKWYCPCCGSPLKRISREDKEWSLFSQYESAHKTKYLLCTKSECFYSESPWVLCHPVYGWTHPPGDSFALAYVK